MRTTLVLLHLAIALVVLVVLGRQYVAAAGAAKEARVFAADDRQETLRVEADIERMKAVRDGLKRSDPFVVELVARDRLRFTGPGEFTPPRMPVVDSPVRTGR